MIPKRSAISQTELKINDADFEIRDLAQDPDYAHE
jgi:hypothetical protein